MTYRLTDYHTHTKYCDGKSSVREMAEQAHALGFSALGFSGHGYTPFDGSYCMSRENTEKYLAEIAELKEEYRGKMEILAGVEADVFAQRPEGNFDYVIGSSHYIKLSESYHPLDISVDGFRALLERGFGGDFEALAEQYYGELASLFPRLGADIIGHFDLITKYAEVLPLPRGERYYAAALGAIDKLLEQGKPFEINVGAITRAYRSSPYPDEKILTYIHERGGKVIVTGDCHSAESLGKYLDTGIALAKKCGFTYRLVLTHEGFKKVEI